MLKGFAFSGSGGSRLDSGGGSQLHVVADGGIGRKVFIMGKHRAIISGKHRATIAGKVYPGQ